MNNGNNYINDNNNLKLKQNIKFIFICAHLTDGSL